MAALKPARFFRDERGSLSVEALFWFMLVVGVLAIFVDGTSMFSAQGKILRIVADANRAYSVGFLDTTTDVENYIKSRLSSVSSVSATAKVSGQVIYTTVTVPATDFQVFGLIPPFQGLTITARADHLIEPSS